MRTGPKVKAARLPAINPKNTARVPDLALLPPRWKKSGAFRIPSRINTSHGPSTIFHGIYQSRWVKFFMAICFHPTCKSTLNNVWMINVTKNHLRETPGHLLENMANLGNNMAGKEGRTSFIFTSACLHCRKNTFDMCMYTYALYCIQYESAGNKILQLPYHQNPFPPTLRF